MFRVSSKHKAVGRGRMLGKALTSIQTAYCLLLTAYFIFTVSLANAGNPNVHLADVQSMFMQKDFAKTKELAQSLIAQSNDVQEKSRAFYYAGLSDLWLGQYVSARQLITQAMNDTLSKSWQDMAALALIDTYYMEGDYKKSLRLTEDFLDEHPKSEFLSLVYLKLARSHLKLANWKKGRDYLEKITKEFPNSLERFYVEQLLEESQFFAVQVGSFQERSMAEALMNDLQKKGEYAYIVETSSQDGKKFFRVRVGKFQQFDEAQKLETKLARLGYPTKIYP